MHIAVVGTGIVGVCSAAWLQRDGHRITFIDPRPPGEACSFGNAGSLSPSACLPVGMPGMWKRVPGWLTDPLGPLTVRWSYLPRALPWLLRFLHHSSPQEVTRIATALRGLLAPIFESYGPLVEHAGVQELVRRSGCLYVYSSRETANQWKWGMNLRRSLGVELRDVGEEELVALEPDLKGKFRFGLLAPDNGSTSDPSALVKAIHAKCVSDGAVSISGLAVSFVKINKGPTPEDRYIQAQVAADEAHQGFIDCRLLRSFGPDGEAMVDDLLRRRMGDHPIDAFNVPFESWIDTIAFCFTMDLVAWYHLRAMENSSFAPWAREMTTMVHEEKFHASFGARRVTDVVQNPEYARLCGATRADVQRAIDKWYPRALDTFGKSDSRFSDLAVGYGIRRWGNAELRRMYKDDIDAQIRGLGLDVPPEDRDRKIF